MTDPGNPPPVPPGAIASTPSGQAPSPQAPPAPGGDDRLATAFTRIVGEQLNEQREITALLAALRSRLDGLDGLTQEMDLSVARRVAVVAAEVREVIERRGDPEDARREAAAAREQIVAARSQVYDLSSSLGAAIEGIEAELAGLSPAVAGLGPVLAALAPRLEELSPQLTGLEGQLGGIGGQLGGVESQLGGIGGQLGGVESQLGGIGGQLGGLEGQLGGLDAQLDALRASVSALAATTAMDELADGMAGMRTDLRSLPEQVGGAVGGRVAESLEAVRASVRAVVTDLATLQAAVSVTPGPDPLMTELEAQLAGVASRVTALGELPEQLEGVSTDLGAVWQAVQVLDGKLGALPTDEDLVPTVAGVGAAVVALQAAVAQLDERFESFASTASVGPDPELAEVSDSVVAVGVSLSEMRTTLGGVSGRLDDLAARTIDNGALGELSTDIAALHSRFAAVDGRFDAITELVSSEDSDVGPALDGLHASLAGVSGAVGDLDSKLDALTLAIPGPPLPDARLDVVGSSVQEVSDDVAALAARVDVLLERPTQDTVLQAAVVALDDRIDDLAREGIGPMSASVDNLGADLAALSARLTALEAGIAEGAANAAAREEQAPTPLASSDLAELTAPLTGEVAGLRGDLDNVRRLLLEDLPDESMAPAELAAEIDAVLAETLGAKVSEAVERAVAGAVEDAVARALQTRVEDAVRITVTPSITQAVESAVNAAAGQQVELESRLRAHVDEAVLALAEIILNTPSLVAPRSPAAPAAVPAEDDDEAFSGYSYAPPAEEPPTYVDAESAAADASVSADVSSDPDKKRRFGRK